MQELIKIENEVVVQIPQLFQNIVYGLLSLIILLQLTYIIGEQIEFAAFKALGRRLVRWAEKRRERGNNRG